MSVPHVVANHFACSGIAGVQDSLTSSTFFVNTGPFLEGGGG